MGPSLKIKPADYWNLAEKFKAEKYDPNLWLKAAKEPAHHSKLFAGCSLDEKSGELIVKVINISGDPQDTSINLAGAPRPYLSATALTLTGEGPIVENTYAEPFKVAPIESTIAMSPASRGQFRHTFRAYSVTILRLQSN